MYEDINQVLSVVLHEMRSPINAILSILQLAEHNDEKIDDYLRQIKDISNHMLLMSNSVLDDLKCSKKKITSVNTSFNLHQIINEVTSVFCCQMKLKQICFKQEEIKTEISLYGEVMKIKQILINLLSNSMKYTNSGGKVLIRTEVNQLPDNAEVCFIVKDNGIGMSRYFIRKLYRPFTQAEFAECSSGLGLMIVHQFVKQMGGTIKVQSKKHQGTTFTVRLSLPYGEIIDRKSDTIEHQRLLLVDDSMINLELVECILKTKGVEVDIAVNGKIAFNKFIDSPNDYYKMILMDMRMPILDGINAAKAIRSLNRKDAQEVKIIAFSSSALDEDHDKALAAGMNDFIYKPVEANKLLAIINKYL